MLSFCGQDKTSIDSSGRIKLSSRVLSDFMGNGGYDVVLHCLPEGAIAVYPEAIYLKMRSNEVNPAEKAGESLVYRRTMRRFGAMTQSQCISTQGRITIPNSFRECAEIKANEEIVVVGCEIGIEIWNAEKWNKELSIINKHAHEKGENEMEEDLAYKTIETNI